METSAEIILNTVIAAALGGLIGLERQVSRRHVDTPFSGMRTFALYSVWGFGAGLLSHQFGAAAFAVATVAFGGILVVEYWFVGGRGETGTTTVAASFVAFLVGVIVWSGFQVAALAVSVGVAALLQSKIWVHGTLARFTGEDLRAVLRFGVLTAVILPLVPNRFMGPFDALNPFQVWLMVVFVAGVGLVGYVALRILGPQGLAPTGLVGGLVSSTAVTLGFSRMARSSPELTNALSAGVLAASGLMYVRVLIWTTALAPALAGRLLPALIALFVIVEGAAGLSWWMTARKQKIDPDLDIKNPVGISSALQFGVLYAAIIVIAKGLVERLNEASLSVVGVVSGINDVDAITLATSNLVREETVGASPAAKAIIAAVTVNTLVKAAMATFIGGRRLAIGVGLVLAVAAAGGVVAWFLV